MSYIAPKDYAQDPQVAERIMKTLSGDLDLSWMSNIGERAAFRPSNPKRGFTLDDINHGAYGPDRVPEIVRHNFSMAPRGAILPPGLPSLGYKVNRKSDVWSDLATRLFEEAKTRRWTPARDVPWQALDGRDRSDRRECAIRQLSTSLVSVGLVCGDVPAYWVWRMNQEFHEVKYLLSTQMFDAARIAEAFRKRALYGSGSLGVDSSAVGELLKMVFESDTYPQASASMNLMLFSVVQALGRLWDHVADNAADSFLGIHLAQDASRFLAYGVDHVRSLARARPVMVQELNEHLDLVENGLVGALGASEVIEPLILLTGGLERVVGFYQRTCDEYFARCRAAGLGERRARSPLESFTGMLRDQESE